MELEGSFSEEGVQVRIHPLPIPIISVMKSELCDFCVTK